MKLSSYQHSPLGSSPESYGHAQKTTKTKKETDFHAYHVFGSFLMVLKSFRGARRLLNNIRTHLDTAGAGLTSPNIEIHQYSCFWECQFIRNDSQNLPLSPGPPQNTFILFLRSSITIFKNTKHV